MRKNHQWQSSSHMPVVVAAGALVALVWTSAGAQAPTQASIGSGVVPITGTVEVSNTLSVRADQSGDWKVAVANTPSVVLPPPDFLTAGTAYDVTWGNGDRERVTVNQVRSDGWVRVEAAEGRRWINVAAARSFQSRR